MTLLLSLSNHQPAGPCTQFLPEPVLELLVAHHVHHLPLPGTHLVSILAHAWLGQHTKYQCVHGGFRSSIIDDRGAKPHDARSGSCQTVCACVLPVSASAWGV